MKTKVYLGIDLGAESGRVMAGLWNGKTIQLEELHRFPNEPLHVGDTMRWDTLRLWAEIQTGLAIAAKKFGKQIVSVGADTWGVDYVLLTKNDELVTQPYHYRDSRTNGVMEKTFRRMPRAKIFEQTGLQFMQLNTLFQLLAMNQRNPELLAQADCLLLTPDFIHWLLCGSRVVEFTNGTTTQCLHPLKRAWSTAMLKQLGLPTRMFPKIVQPGTKLGRLRPALAERLGLPRIQVVAPPTHDTASAVVGVPTANTGKASWAYISSGTWSLMGVEVREACLSKRALELNMTNEGGFGGTYRLLKNIMGLWLVQGCKRSFDARGETHDYAELVTMASKAKPLRSLLNLDDPRFLNPPDMPRAIQNFCRETGQPVPKTKGELVRCALESLALKYREVLGNLEELTGERIEVIHIVGGGSKNKLLSQFAADACGRPVITGPVEATVMGNLLVQVWADGGVKSLAQIRDVVRRSSDTVRYEPRSSERWTEAAERLSKLKKTWR